MLNERKIFGLITRFWMLDILRLILSGKHQDLLTNHSIKWLIKKWCLNGIWYLS